MTLRLSDDRQKDMASLVRFFVLLYGPNVIWLCFILSIQQCGPVAVDIIEYWYRTPIRSGGVAGE